MAQTAREKNPRTPLGFFGSLFPRSHLSQTGSKKHKIKNTASGVVKNGVLSTKSDTNLQKIQPTPKHIAKHIPKQQKQKKSSIF